MCVWVCCLHVYATGSCKASVSGPLRKVGQGQVCRIQGGGGRAHWVLTLKLVHAHILTHKQRNQTHALLASGSLSVSRCFLPSRPNRTASAPHRHTRYFPAGWPAGQVEGQTHPFALSLWFHFFVIFGACSNLTYSPQPRRRELQSRHQVGQEIKTASQLKAHLKLQCLATHSSSFNVIEDQWRCDLITTIQPIR